MSGWLGSRTTRDCSSSVSPSSATRTSRSIRIRIEGRGAYANFLDHQSDCSHRHSSMESHRDWPEHDSWPSLAEDLNSCMPRSSMCFARTEPYLDHRRSHRCHRRPRRTVTCRREGVCGVSSQCVQQILDMGDILLCMLLSNSDYFVFDTRSIFSTD